MLNDKIALVTGAASGIGRAIALAYADAGAKVVVSDFDVAGGEETVALLHRSGRDAVFAPADVTKPEDCVRMVERAVEAFGRLDIACNNAGIAADLAPTANYPLESWNRVITTNLSGVFHCMRAQIPALLQAGGGAIVNIASILGTVGFANTSAYTAAKHGVVGLTRSAALEYASRQVRINAVGPGFIHTPMIGRLEDDPATLAGLMALHPMGRLGRPEDVAALVLWLSSPAAAFATGGYYPIDGGYLAR